MKNQRHRSQKKKKSDRVVIEKKKGKATTSEIPTKTPSEIWF